MTRPFTVALIVVLSANLYCLGQAVPAPPNPLDYLDKAFVPAYDSRTTLLDSAHPAYVEVFGSSLFLHLHGNVPLQARVLTDPYHRLKDVAHAPFTVYLLLAGLSGQQLSDSQTIPILSLQQKLKGAQEALSSGGFTGEQLARQKQILDASRQIVDRTLADRKVNQEILAEFAHSMGPLMLQNADEAGCFQVQATHAQMMRWKTLMTKDEWQSIHVVIKNSHQARYRNAATQYFSWLFGGSSSPWAYAGETSRVIYAETLFEKQTAGNELLAVLVDFDASRAFFGDDWRLSEDILSNGAARCVKLLSPADRDWKQL